MPDITLLAAMAKAWAKYDHQLAKAQRLRDRADYKRARSDALQAASDGPWDESLRLRDLSDGLYDESAEAILRVAQALYGKNARIDWDKRTVILPLKGR